MGLLDELRADTHFGRGDNDKWTVLPSLLSDAMEGYQHGKTVLLRGEVIVNGVVRSGMGRRYLYAVLHSESTAADHLSSRALHKTALFGEHRPAGGVRPALMGIDRYRAECEANYYSDPWTAWVAPEPEAFADWIAGVLNSTKGDTPYLEKKYRASRS